MTDFIPYQTLTFIVPMLLGDQIRILDLLPCEDGNDESLIQCELRIVALDDHPEFDALSYCWGTNSINKQQIKVSDTCKEISAHLHAALRRLRVRDRKRQLWIDQLCIDQNNTDEKTHQVRLMPRIYSACRWCFIWFGDLQDGSDELAWASAAAELIEYLANEDATLPWDPTPENLQKAAQGVHSMCPKSHPWWKRIWTYQEALLPRRKSILWGPLVVPWQSLTQARARTLTHSFFTGMRLDRSAFRYPGLNPISNCLDNLLLTVQWINTTAAGGDDLLVILMKTRSRRDAHQPHDQVFGMLGLVSPKDAPNSHKCNYETSPAQVYSAATLDMIVARRCLLPLVMNPRIGDKKGTANIPRWAIDMASIPNHGADIFYIYWGYKSYNACAGRALDIEAFQRAMTERSIQHRILYLKGVLVDTVNVLADERLLIPGTQNLRAAIPSTLQIWRALARSCVGQGPHGMPDHELDENLARLILGDLLRDISMSVTRKPDRNDIAKGLTLMNGNFLWGEERSIWPREDILHSQICNQTFFITQGGMLGMGHLEMEAGDEVWIFDGGHVPFIVRKRDEPSTFDFVGRCYVQGIMHGEAYKDQSIETRRRAVRVY